MLDPKYVLENPELVVKKAAARGVEISLGEVKELSTEKKDYLQKTENLRYERNKASQLVARKKREGEDPSSIISEMKEVGQEIKLLEERLKEIEEKQRKILLTIPNIKDRNFLLVLATNLS